MEEDKRSKAILSFLTASRAPVNGSRLALSLGISKTSVSHEIALLQAKGEPIIGTPLGYRYGTPDLHPSRVFYCRHIDLAEARTELMLIVQCGGLIRDVTFCHPVYGEVRSTLLIGTQQEADDLIEIYSGRIFRLLTEITNGIHRYTVDAESEKTLDFIESSLRLFDLLI